jgi:hypothetical protein
VRRNLPNAIAQPVEKKICLKDFDPSVRPDATTSHEPSIPRGHCRLCTGKVTDVCAPFTLPCPKRQIHRLNDTSCGLNRSGLPFAGVRAAIDVHDFSTGERGVREEENSIHDFLDFADSAGRVQALESRVSGLCIRVLFIPAATVLTRMPSFAYSRARACDTE